MVIQQVSKMTALRAGRSTCWRTENVYPPPADGGPAPPTPGSLPLKPPPFLGIGVGVGSAGAALATPGVLVGTPLTSQTIWLPFLSQTGLAPAVVVSDLGVKLSPISIGWVP